MASRENQGLHIALILLVMLTVGLCVTSYVFYSKATTSQSESAEATRKLTEMETERDDAMFKSQKLIYMINGGAKTWNDVEEELTNIPDGSADDPVMDAIAKSFKDNMMLYGAAEEEHESARNYESLPTFLLARIRDLNQQLTDLRRSENELTRQKADLEQAAAERNKEYEAGQEKARADLAAEREKFRQQRDTLQKQKDDVASQLTGKDNKILELTNTLNDQQQKSAKEIADLRSIVTDQKIQIAGLRQETFEVPDATITSVNQRERIAYIDVGSADKLRQQQTFSVYDKGVTGIMKPVSKARIEVIEILGDHVAMCSILDDNMTNIVLPGDIVFTPAWSPGRTLHFAAAGLIDITGDGRNDLELLKSLIETNGGVLDDEVTVQTRYLIEGEDKGEGVGGEQTGEERAGRTAKIKMAEQIGVDRIDLDKLLMLMGWRADVRAVTLGRGSGGFEVTPKEEEAESPFRKRTPPRGDNGAF